jgi:hypothetical protein
MVLIGLPGVSAETEQSLDGAGRIDASVNATRLAKIGDYPLTRGSEPVVVSIAVCQQKLISIPRLGSRLARVSGGSVGNGGIS